ERGLRLVLRDLGMHLLHLGRRDIRRVAREKVAVPDEFRAFEGLEQVADSQVDPLAEPGELGIALCQLYRFRREIGGAYARLRLIVGIGEGEIGAAGAHVYDGQLAALLRHATDLDQGGAAENLGFLARNQRCAARQELAAEESLALRAVRERHAGL